jgi:hypothetical protein
MSCHSRKRAIRATVPTTMFSKPRGAEAEPAADAELAKEALELTLPAAVVADADTELSLLVILAEDLEPEDCEAVWADDAVSEAVMVA